MTARRTIYDKEMDRLMNSDMKGYDFHWIITGQKSRYGKLKRPEHLCYIGAEDAIKWHEQTVATSEQTQQFAEILGSGICHGQFVHGECPFDKECRYCSSHNPDLMATIDRSKPVESVKKNIANGEMVLFREFCFTHANKPGSCPGCEFSHCIEGFAPNGVYVTKQQKDALDEGVKVDIYSPSKCKEEVRTQVPVDIHDKSAFPGLNCADEEISLIHMPSSKRQEETFYDEEITFSSKEDSSYSDEEDSSYSDEEDSSYSDEEKSSELAQNRVIQIQRLNESLVELRRLEEERMAELVQLQAEHEAEKREAEKREAEKQAKYEAEAALNFNMQDMYARTLAYQAARWNQQMMQMSGIRAQWMPFDPAFPCKPKDILPVVYYDGSYACCTQDRCSNRITVTREHARHHLSIVADGPNFVQLGFGVKAYPRCWSCQNRHTEDDVQTVHQPKDVEVKNHPSAEELMAQMAQMTQMLSQMK